MLTRSLVVFAAAALGAACGATAPGGSGTDPADDTTTVAVGSVEGAELHARTALFGVIEASVPMAVVVVADHEAGCEIAKGIGYKNAAALQFLLASALPGSTGGVPPKGDYVVGASWDGFGPTKPKMAVASFGTDDETCTPVIGVQAISGKVTVLSSSTERLAATFELRFAGGDGFSGSFSASPCTIDYSEIPDPGSAGCRE